MKEENISHQRNTKDSNKILLTTICQQIGQTSGNRTFTSPQNFPLNSIADDKLKYLVPLAANLI